jgi:lipopolysaccharide exporter
LFLFKKNNLFTNLAKIFSATVLAHAVTLAFSPVLTRMYLPEAFGLLAFILSVCNPFSSLATFRLEQAVVLPKENKDALNVANTVIILNTLFSLLLFVVMVLWGEKIFNKNTYVLMFAPLIVLVSGFQMPLNSWLQREKKYNVIANGKIIQTIAISVFSILMYKYHSNYGLLMGYVLGWCVYSFYMFIQSNKQGFSLLITNAQYFIKQTLKTYKDFPLFHVLPSVAVSFTLSIPVFYFNNYFSETEIGWFNFSRQLLLVPVSLVGAAFSQVYYARVIEMKNHRKKIFPEFKKILSMLLGIALCMLVLFYFGGEIIFKTVFGNNWVISGKYASILVFSAAMQFVVWPLNIIPIALGKIKFNSIFQLSHFVLTLSLFLLNNLNPIEFIYFVVAIDALFYITYFMFIFYQVKAHDKV